MSSEKLNIGQRMLAVCKAYGYARKTKTVDSYKALSYDILIGEIRQYILDAGILILPVLVDSKTCETGKQTKSKANIIRFETVYDVHFCNADDTKDRVTVRVPAHGEDYGDKAAGKATTYAVKSAIVKGFMIESGEDEESRVQNFQRALTKEERSVLVNEMEAATTRVELRGLLRAALAKADEVGDEVAFESFKAEAELLASKLPEGEAKAKPADAPAVAMPVAKAAANVAPSEPGAQPRTPEQNQDADPPPAGEPIAVAPGVRAAAVKEAAAVVVAKRGKPASAGMVKMLEVAVGDKRPKMRAAILARRGVESFAELDKDEIATELAKVMELTKPKETV